MTSNQNYASLIEQGEALQAHPYQRTDERKGYANGFKNKMLQTRMGKLQLHVPKTRNIPFYPKCLDKGTRSERALRLAIAEMYVNGVSTRRVKRITEELCGLEISSTQVSRVSKLLDEELEKFRSRPLGNMRYVYLDARYEKVRENGSVRDLAVFTAIGVNEKGRREVLGISYELSEAEIHWRSFLESLLKRGLTGVQLIISDDHAGLKKARQAVLPGTAWQRCYFHLAQNAGHYAPNQSAKKAVGLLIRDIYNAPNKEEAKSRLRSAINLHEKKWPHLTKWMEENCEKSMSFYDYPSEHWRKIRTNNVSKRLNQEIQRRTSVARLFPNRESCLRVSIAVFAEIHEDWVSDKSYITVKNQG